GLFTALAKWRGIVGGCGIVRAGVGRDECTVAGRVPGRARWLATSLAMSAALATLALTIASSPAAEAARPVAATVEAQLCAASGQQILAGNTVRAAVYQEQFSHYSLRRSRCYVEMRVEIMATDEVADRFGRFLYDGGTRELLAFAQIEGGRKSGRVFDLDHRTTTFENSGWDD